MSAYASMVMLALLHCVSSSCLIDVAAGSCYSYDKKSDFAPLVGQIGDARGRGELGLWIWWHVFH